VRDEQNSNEDPYVQVFIDCLLASADYDSFYKVMAKEGHKSLTIKNLKKKSGSADAKQSSSFSSSSDAKQLPTVSPVADSKDMTTNPTYSYDEKNYPQNDDDYDAGEKKSYK
jgi:hypothetical protein